MRRSILILLLFAVIFIWNASIFASEKDLILDELKALNIEVTGPVAQSEEELPLEFNGPFWGLLNNMCRDSGWDLSTYAGKKVLYSNYTIKDKYGNEPLDVWIISSGDKVICIYKSVREGSSLAPGLFVVHNPAKDKVKQSQ